LPNPSTQKRESRIRRAVRWPRPCVCPELTTGRTGPARGRQRKGSPPWRPQEACWRARPRRSMAFPHSAPPPRLGPRTRPPSARRSATRRARAAAAWRDSRATARGWGSFRVSQPRRQLRDVRRDPAHLARGRHPTPRRQGFVRSAMRHGAPIARQTRRYTASPPGTCAASEAFTTYRGRPPSRRSRAARTAAPFRVLIRVSNC
jgi:hypothetical protein